MRAILVDDKRWRKEIEVEDGVTLIHWTDGVFAIDFELDEVEKDGTPVFRMTSKESPQE